MTEEEKQQYELIFKQIELIGQSYLHEILRLVKIERFYETKSQEFGLILQALQNGRLTVHDTELYIKMLRNKITEQRMAYDSEKK